MTKMFTLYARPCIVVEEDNEDSLEPAVLVTSTAVSGDGLITIHTGDGDEIVYDSTNINIDPTGALIDFKVDGVQYFIRTIREEDGEWLSNYGVMLPPGAVDALIRGGSQMAVGDETMTAYAMDDSPYVVGLVYTNPGGSWSRVDGDWNLLADRDPVFDDMIPTPIDPSKAMGFVDQFDNNYVSIDDLDQYSNDAQNADNVVVEEDAPVAPDDSEPPADAAPGEEQ